MTYCWYFTREDIDRKTPSREDGIPAAVETRYRRDGAKFLINASNTFGLYPHILKPPATALVGGPLVV